MLWYDFLKQRYYQSQANPGCPVGAWDESWTREVNSAGIKGRHCDGTLRYCHGTVMALFFTLATFWHVLATLSNFQTVSFPWSWQAEPKKWDREWVVVEWTPWIKCLSMSTRTRAYLLTSKLSSEARKCRYHNTLFLKFLILHSHTRCQRLKLREKPDRPNKTKYFSICDTSYGTAFLNI